MKINALLMDLKDNVVTCVADITAGMRIYYREGEEVRSLVACEDIPYCHKIALCDVRKGEEIIKYGESIGKVNCDVSKGYRVWDKNLTSVPRDYDTEMILL